MPIVELTNGKILFAEEVYDDHKYINPVEVLISGEHGLSFQPVALFNTEERAEVKINSDQILLTYDPDKLFIQAASEFRTHYENAKKKMMSEKSETPNLSVVPDGSGQ